MYEKPKMVFSFIVLVVSVFLMSSCGGDSSLEEAQLPALLKHCMPPYLQSLMARIAARTLAVIQVIRMIAGWTLAVKIQLT